MNDDLKNKLDNFAYEDVNPQEIWDGILAKQNDKNRIVFKPFWIFVIGLIIVPITLYYTLSTTSDAIDAHANKNVDVHQMAQTNLSTPNKIISSTTKETNFNHENLTTTRSTRQPSSSKILDSNSTKSSFHKTDFNVVRQTALPITNRYNLANKFIEQQSKLSTEHLHTSNRVRPLLSSLNLLRSSTVVHSLTVLERPMPSMPAITILDRRSKPVWSISLIGDMSNLQSSLKPLDNSTTTQDRIQNLASSSTPQLALDNRLLLGLQFANGLELSTGLAYNQTRELFRYRGSHVEDSNGDIISETVFDENGLLIADFSNTSNTQDLFQSIERNVEVVNLYHFVDVPLQLGYNYRLGQFQAGIYGALAVNIYNNNQGFDINEFGVPIRFEEISLTPHISPRMYGGVSLGYQLIDGIGFSLGLEYSQRNIRFNNIATKQQTLGGTLGMKWNF